MASPPILFIMEYAMSITTLTKSNFEAEVIKKPGVSVVRFWAPWCGPCRMMEPLYQDLAQTLATKAAFGEVEIDAEPEIAGALGIRSIPTVVVFKDGRPVDQMVGLGPKSNYVSLIERQLAA